jgi:hypothetical protein
MTRKAFEDLGKPKPGGVADCGTAATTYSGGASRRVLEMRFLGRPVRA